MKRIIASWLTAAAVAVAVPAVAWAADELNDDILNDEKAVQPGGVAGPDSLYTGLEQGLAPAPGVMKESGWSGWLDRLGNEIMGRVGTEQTKPEFRLQITPFDAPLLPVAPGVIDLFPPKPEQPSPRGDFQD